MTQPQPDANAAQAAFESTQAAIFAALEATHVIPSTWYCPIKRHRVLPRAPKKTDDDGLLSEALTPGNSHFPINKLPPELLARILRQTCDDVVDLPTLWTLLHVCKYWYDVVAHDPDFYLAIDPVRRHYGERTVRAFAERSKASSLHLFWGATQPIYSQMPWLDRFYLDNIHRIQVLHLQMWHGEPWQWVLSTPAPQLVECSISTPPNPMRLSKNRPAVLPQLFGRDAPHLRDLTLRDGRLAWRSDNYHNLSTLRIVMPENGRSLQVPDGPESLDLGDVTTVFAGSPKLRSLELVSKQNQGRAHWGDLHFQSTSRVTARHLQSLRLMMRLEYILHILRHTQVTSSIASVHLTATDDKMFHAPQEEVTNPSRSDLLHSLCIDLDPVVRLMPVTYFALLPKAIGLKGYRNGRDSTLIVDGLQISQCGSRQLAELACVTWDLPMLSSLSITSDYLPSLPVFLRNFPTIARIRVLTPTLQSIQGVLSAPLTPVSSLFANIEVWEISPPDIDNKDTDPQDITVELPSQDADLIVALCRLSHQGCTIVFDGYVVAERLDAVQDFVLEIAKHSGRLMGCGFTITQGHEDGLRIVDTIQELWPVGELPAEVGLVVKDSGERRAHG